MASRWMQQMKARQRAFNKREAKISLTERERKFYQRQRGESIEHHIWRMLYEASSERLHPTEWWRRLARVTLVIPSPYDDTERTLITKSINRGDEVIQTQASILRYRKLTGRHQVKKPTITREDEYYALALI